MAQNEKKEATLLSVAIEEFGKKFSPDATAEKKTRVTISTDFVVSQLDGIADFERQEVANKEQLACWVLIPVAMAFWCGVVIMTAVLQGGAA